MPDDFESFLQANAPQPATPGGAPALPAPVAAPAQATDPFESFLADQKSQQDMAIKSQAQGTVVANSDQSADAAGRAAQLSKQIGVPQAAVETDIPRYEAQAKAQQNAATVAANPKLATWVAQNPDSARVAQDDFDGMANIDKLVSDQLWGAAKPIVSQLGKSFAGGFNASSLAVNRAIGAGASGIDAVAGTNASDWWYKNMVQPALQNRAALAAPADAPFGVKAADVTGNLLSMLAQIALTGGAGTATEGATAVPTAAEAVTQTVAHGARSMAFPSLTSAVNTGKDVYDQTGDMQQAIRASQMSYATTTLGGIVPLGAEGGLATRAATGFLSGAVSGDLSRQAMNLVMPQQQGFDPEQTILSGLSGAMLSGAMGRNPLHDGVQQAFTDGIRAETAERGGSAIEQLSQIAAASKLRQNDPEAFRNYVQQVSEDGPLSDIYVDGETFANALHQSEVDPNNIPGLQARLDEAVQTGGDVQIPIEDYATHIAGTDLDKAILPELKSEEGGMTYAEGQRFYQDAAGEMEARAKDIVAQQDEQTTQQDDVKAIGDKLFEQMQATGRFPDDVSRSSVAPVAEFYRTMAERLGMKPGELYDQFPLRVAGESLAGESLGQGGESLNKGEPARGAFSPDTNTIALLKGADLSTFLHESGHFFLSTLGDLAGREDVPQQIKDDMQTAIHWMGGKDIADWQGRTLDQQRDMHEKFARGFETYLMEGKAPSAEMQPLFARFRSWLLNVYRSITGLNAELTPEVRGVFDRLLASDDAIKQAEQQRGYFPLDLSKSGATEKQLSDYAALGEKATQDAVSDMQARSLRDMKWASNAKNKAIKALQKEAVETRKAVQRETTRDIMKRPIYQAWQFLTLRGHEPGTQALPEPKIKSSAKVDPARDSLFEAIAKYGGLNRDEIKGQWGVDHRDIGDSGIFGKPIVRKTGGLSIDRMAEKLHEDHYLDAHDLTEFEEKFDAERSGQNQYSWEHQYANGEEAPIEPVNLDEKYHGKLSTSDLKNMFGDAQDAIWRKLSDLGMTSDKTGVDSDILAETFGFGSGREMVQLLAQVDTPYNAIKKLTDQRMLQRHGELTDPQAIDAAANEAVHNEARARFMATGLKILTKSPIPVRELTKAATEAAETAIAGKRVRDLNPKQYEVAEAKANKEALEQAPKSPEKAVEAQRQALLSNRLAKAAQDAVAQVKKIVDSQKRYDKASIRAKMDPDILEQIDALRERFDFRKNPPEGPTKQQTQLQTWVDSQKAFGYAPMQHPDMLDPTVRMHYKDMTVEQLRGFNDTIRSMEQIARERKSVMVDGKKVELKEVVGDLVGKMQAQAAKFTTEELVDRPRAGVDPFFKVALDRMSSFLRAASAEFKPQQFKANHFDQHEILGPFTRSIFARVFDANYRKVDMLKGMSMEFRAAADKLGVDWQNSLHELVPNTRLLDTDLTEEQGSPVYRRLTRGDMLGIARHVGNESNFDKLTKGMGWEPRDVWSFLSENMTAKDWEATQATWDAFEKHWPAMVDMNKRLGNTAPDRVEPRAFKTQFGEMRGGYSPLDYDPIRSKLAVRKSDASAINPSEGLFGKGYFRADTTTNGSLNARKANYYDKLDLDYHSLERRLHDTVHDLAYREALLDVHKILSDADFRRQFLLSYGPEQYKSMQTWVGDLANGQNSDAQMSRLGAIMNATRRMVVANGIALRISTVLKHGGSAGIKSSGYFSGGGGKYFSARAAKMVTDNSGQIQGAMEKFPEIRARLMQQDRDYRQTSASLFQPESLHARAERFGHAAVAWSDMMTAVPTAWGAYDRAITEGIPVNRGGTGKPMSEADAVEYANQIVREAHGSNIESSRSMILQDKNEAVKMFTTLYGFMNNTLGQNMDMVSKFKTAGFSKPEVLARYMMAMIVPALWAGALAKPDKKEGWAKWAAKAITGEYAGMVPMLRDAWSAVEGYSSAGVPSYMSVLGTVAKPAQDIYKAAHGKEVKAPIKDVGNAIGLMIPGAGQVGTSLQYAADVKSGKQQPKNALDVARGFALGQGNQ
jgi:hypothetical protein